MMENLSVHNGNKPTVEDVLTKIQGLWWLVDMFVVFARENISHKPSLIQYYIYLKVLKDLEYALTNREVLNRSFEAFRSLYGKDAKLEFTDDETLNRALKRLLVDPESMNNPFEFQDALEGIRNAIKIKYDQLNRILIEDDLFELMKNLEKTTKGGVSNDGIYHN